MRKVLLGIAGAAALSIASGAQAQITFVPVAPDSSIFFEGNVGCDDPTAATPCAFMTSGSFTAPLGFDLVSATITSVFQAGNPSGDIDFTSVTLNGISFNLDPSGAVENGSLLNQLLLPGAFANTINVSGTTGGSGTFNGSLAFAVGAVPEPATWAMMLLGFAGIGSQIRRRRQKLQVHFA